MQGMTKEGGKRTISPMVAEAMLEGLNRKREELEAMITEIDGQINDILEATERPAAGKTAARKVAAAGGRARKGKSAEDGAQAE